MEERKRVESDGGRTGRRGWRGKEEDGRIHKTRVEKKTGGVKDKCEKRGKTQRCKKHKRKQRDKNRQRKGQKSDEYKVTQDEER